MVKNRRSYKIILMAVLLMALSVYASAQKQQPKPLIDVPIVSDKAVAKTDTIRIVTKDENQRIIDKLVKRIQSLEDRVAILEVRGR